MAFFLLLKTATPLVASIPFSLQIYYVPKSGLLLPRMELDGEHFDKGITNLLNYLLREMPRKPSSDKKGQPPKVKELKKHKKMQAEIVAGSNPTCRGEAGTKPISKSKAFVFAPKRQS